MNSIINCAMSRIMNNATRALGLLLLVGSTTLASAAEQIRPFTADSYGSILATRADKPFLLALWSVTCAHCPAELRTLGELQRRHPQLDIVLIATDTPADADDAARLAREYGLAAAEQWIFADAMPERLRTAIDRRWRGELPRTYFFDRTHHVEAQSGVASAARISSWIRQHIR